MTLTAVGEKRRAVRGRARGRRRRYAAAAALTLAAALGVAGCGQSGGPDHASAAHAPVQQPANGRGAATSGAGGGSGTTGGPAAADGTASAPRTGGAGGTAAAAGRGPATAGGAPSAASYLVRTAHLTVRTPHIQRQSDAARALAAAAGGYAGDEDTSVDAQGHTRSTIELRVPPRSYDGLLTRLAGLGTLVSRQVTVEDVTGQVVDVASRIASQKASVARVRALMDRANGISDVVSLESELTTRESALESLEAQQASLRSRTDLATVSLRLVEPPVKAAPPVHEKVRHDGFWTVVGHGLRDGWHALAATLRVLMVVLAVLLPFLLLGLLGWSAYRLARRLLPERSPGRRASAVSLRTPGGTAREVTPYPVAPVRVPGPAAGREEPSPDARPAGRTPQGAFAGPAVPATGPARESAKSPADGPATVRAEDPAEAEGPDAARPDA